MRKEEDILTESPDRDDPEPVTTVLVAVLFALLTVAIVVALQGYFEYVQDREFRAKVVDVPPAELQQAREEGQAQLEGYRWLDRDGGVVSIPIERAMDQVVERLED